MNKIRNEREITPDNAEIKGLEETIMNNYMATKSRTWKTWTHS